MADPAAVLAQMQALNVQSPAARQKIWKDECAFSFATPESEGGLYVNLRTFQAFSEGYVELDHERTGNTLYLHQNWTRLPPEEKMETEEAPTKLAIGVEGGFSAGTKPQGELLKENSLVLFPHLGTKIPFPGPAQLPLSITACASAVLAYDDAVHQASVAAWSADNEPRKVSRYAEGLEQLDNGKRILPDPATWVCEESGMTTNLWLNLSTGHIGSGRRNWDGTGGTGAALTHFNQTGQRYPLVVKLGTITPSGEADVFSYAPDEDDMVTDPHLERHLAHWGIMVGEMQKTEKSMAEMEVDLNATYAFGAAIMEEGEKLTPVLEPGAVGLRNLGNSCYVSSVMQSLFNLQPFRKRFLLDAGGADAEACASARRVAFRSAPAEPQTDVPTQLLKLAAALSLQPAVVQGRAPSAVSPEDYDEFAPRIAMLKQAAAGGKAEFVGGQQQDAKEYLNWLLDGLADALKGGGEPSPGELFNFVREERTVCGSTGQVGYKSVVERVLELAIPLEAASNVAEVAAYEARKAEADAAAAAAAASAASESGREQEAKRSKLDEEPVVPEVAFEACLNSALGHANPETVEQWRSPATKEMTTCTKSDALGSLPKLLALSLRRYVLRADWREAKVDAKVRVPERIVLGEAAPAIFAAAPIGRPKEGEIPLPADDGAAAAAAAAVEPDPALVEQLMGMGFPHNGCKRAAIATKNAGAEAAMEWILAHMGDADFDTPPAAPSAAAAAVLEPDEVIVSQLVSMGFALNGCKRAALATKNAGVEPAMEWVLAHMGDADFDSPPDVAMAGGGGGGGVGEQGDGLSDAVAEVLASNDAADKKGTAYSLRAIISHLGKNLGSGHYVCHVRQPGTERWLYFNDAHVHVSKRPPFDHGYIYIFERVDVDGGAA